MTYLEWFMLLFSVGALLIFPFAFGNWRKFLKTLLGIILYILFLWSIWIMAYVLTRDGEAWSEVATLGLIFGFVSTYVLPILWLVFLYEAMTFFRHLGLKNIGSRPLMIRIFAWFYVIGLITMGGIITYFMATYP